MNENRKTQPAALEKVPVAGNAGAGSVPAVVQCSQGKSRRHCDPVWRQLLWDTDRRWNIDHQRNRKNVGLD